MRSVKKDPPKAPIVVHREAQPREVQLLREYRAELQELVAEVNGTGKSSFVIEDDEDSVFISELCKFAQARAKEIKDYQEAITKPINAALRVVNSRYLPEHKRWKGFADQLKGMLAAWEEKKAREEEEAARKISEAARAGDYEALHEASKGLMVQTSVVAGVSYQDVWVVDEGKVDLTKVPEKYLALHMPAVNAYIKQAGKNRPKDLPGLPFKAAKRVRVGKR